MTPITLDELIKCGFSFADATYMKERLYKQVEDYFIEVFRRFAGNWQLSISYKYGHDKSKYDGKDIDIESMEQICGFVNLVEEDQTKIDNIVEEEQTSLDEKTVIEICRKNIGMIVELMRIGVLPSTLGEDCVRNHNVGKSDYSKHIIQPWSIWKCYNLDPWKADIIKRILRDKEGEDEEMDYDKIIHICQEKKRQIRLENIAKTTKL